MEIQPIIALALKPFIALVCLLMVEVMERTGLKPIRMDLILRLENFTREMLIMIAGVMITGAVMAVVSEPLISLL